MKFIVGLGENKNIIEAVEVFKKDYDVSISFTSSEEDLVNGVLDSSVDAVIRGSLPAKNLINSLKNAYPDSNINRCTFINNQEYKFIIAPVGIDEALNLEDRLNLASDCISFIRKLNLTPKVAILANGRSDDYNRNKIVDKSLEDSEILENKLKKMYPDISVKNYYILIEKAIEEKFNILLVPDGVIGNILFRSLVLVCKWDSMGAISLGIPEIYIDTSRNQSIDGYIRSLKLAYFLTKNFLDD